MAWGVAEQLKLAVEVLNVAAELCDDHSAGCVVCQAIWDLVDQATVVESLAREAQADAPIIVEGSV